MRNHREEINKEFAYKLISFQFTITLISTLISLLISRDAAISALTGGSIAVLGTAWLARGVFKPLDSKPAKEILVSMYASEIGKLILVFILFYIAFKSVPGLQEPKNALVMFLVFVFTQCVNVIMPLLVKQNNETS